MKPARGFTLVEVIVSIFIIGIMLILLQSVTRTGVFVRNTKFESIALSITRNEIEALRTAGYTNLPSSGTFSDSLLSSLPQGATTTLTISAYNTKTKQVIANVIWLDPSATASSTVSLTTLITQIGGLP